jgi:hypothetical protein
MTKSKGESIVVRRFVTIAVSFCLVLAVGIARVDQLFAQGEPKKDAQDPKAQATPKETPKTDSTKSSEPAATSKTNSTKSSEPAKKQLTSKAEAPKETEPPLPPIPPDVQAKIDAARKAVAEAIVACQDAGLLETSIDPPPVLDILINGRATDKRAMKGAKPYAVSPEVFGAWFTGYGKMEGINYVDDVRIINPSAGLKQWYDQRARILEQYIQDIRRTKGPAPAAKKDQTKPAEPAKASDATKTGASKKSDEPKNK